MFDIRRFCADKGLNQTDFGDIIGVEQSVVSHMARGLRKIRLEHLEKLREKYGDVVDEYRTDRKPQPQAVMSPNPITLQDVQGSYTAEQPAPTVIAVPLVPDKVVRDPNTDVMEWLENADADHTRNAFNVASILRRTKFVIQMNNNAMAPILYLNEYIFLRPFAEDSEIIDGEIYGIESKERGILIRFLYDDGDCYLTRPKNTREFGDIRIPKAGTRLYHIVFHGATHLSSMPDDGELVRKQLNQQSEYVSSLIGELGKSGARQDKLIEMLDKREK